METCVLPYSFSKPLIIALRIIISIILFFVRSKVFVRLVNMNCFTEIITNWVVTMSHMTLVLWKLMLIDGHMLDCEAYLDTLNKHLFPVVELKLYYKPKAGSKELLFTGQETA
jgi:hypothetical protein